MKKRITYAILLCFLTIVGIKFHHIQNNMTLTNLTLANIEALAQTEGAITEEEFAKIGCKATVNPDDRCKGNNGKTYTFALPL